MTDPLQPIYVRLRRSTVAALREAQQASAHRSLASFLEHLIREQLARDEAANRLVRSAAKMRG